MVSTQHLARSKAIQQRTGFTFHVATRLLPEEVRHATYVLYAFFRVADDVVDDPDPAPPDEQRRRLEAMRAVALGEEPPAAVAETADGETAADVLAAFTELRETYDIADEEVEAFMDAMLADVDPADFENHAELSAYLRGSSVAVGAMMLAVMEVSDCEDARPHAAALAEAFQLTNFLRDVREDVTEYDRVYVPASSLAEHGCTPADVRALSPTPGLRATVADELARTEDRYREGVAGIHYLPEDCQLAVLLAAVLYADHHRMIRNRDHDVFTARPTLSVPRRLWLAARTWVAWRRTRDPEAAFYRVSDVEPDPDHPTTPRGGIGDRLRAVAGRPVRRVIDGVPWGWE